ncbi:MAG TPA: Gldg family protein [Candidatus Binataceae bacterium]|nr:Gldg family protein [Candidatus Binataceae bacterium]
MRKSSALYGILGLILLAFGLIDYFIASGFIFFVVINLAGGILAIAVWIVVGRSELASIAGSRATRYGANAAIYTIAFIGLLVAVNYLSTLHNWRIDTTSRKIYSLSSQSVNVVKSLKKPLKFYGFFQGGENISARELYEMYKYANPEITYQLVDPDRNPELAERFKVSVMNTTHIQYGDSDGTNVTELSEEALTNAILRVTKSSNKVIYFLDGHGEADIDDADSAGGFNLARKALEGENYTVKKLLLVEQPSVPADASIVAIAGPKKPLLQHEIDELNAYLKRGGRVLTMLRSPQPGQQVDETALISLIGTWGVKAGNDLVVDQVVQLFAGPRLGLAPMVEWYEREHPITRGFNQKTVFPLVRSLSVEPDLKAGLSVIPIAKTSDTSWAETDLDGIFIRQEAKLDDKDTRGPIAVVDAVQADLDKMGMGHGEARMVVYGDSDFADNQYLSNLYNRDLFMNSADWLAGEENSISIRPPMLRASRFRLMDYQLQIVFALSVLLLPEILSLIGIIVWWERRN